MPDSERDLIPHFQPILISGPAFGACPCAPGWFTVVLRIIDRQPASARRVSMSRHMFWGFAIVGVAIAVIPLSGQERGRGRGAVTLPDGPGKAVVEAKCSTCHA